ncbi:MAG: hypothetical protein ACK4P4_17245 [Allorhizobium sp.]
MTNQHVHITLVTPSQTINRTLSVDDARQLLAQWVPPWELQEALEFLERERFEEGFYYGSDWSVIFRVTDR